jgi:chemotaxis family two-component system sensor kinase Cph1
VDLNDVIARVVDTCAEQLAEAGAAVILRGRLPTVRGDRLLLERAFANLVSNAVKFNESAEKRVVIAPEGDAVAIRDNGIGIDPRHHETIFRVFRRAASGGKYGGTGLGLALVKRILERHNGRIEVESTPGHGATFRVYLPPIAPGAAGAERLLTAHAPDGSVR